MDGCVGKSEQLDDIEREAAEWVVRLGGTPLGKAERVKFDAWLDASPEHRIAFQQARKSWADLEPLRREPGQLRSVIKPVKKSTNLPARRVVLGLALLMIGGGTAVYQIGNPWTALKADFRTAPGEIRTVRLDDGTLVDLGAASAIAIAFDDGIRRVDLLEGEAYFTVAPQRGPEQRPFVAIAAGGSTTALGTQFSVEKVDETAVVTGVEHQIRVTTLALSERGVVLSPGETVRYDTKTGLGIVHKANTETATAWRRGLLVFDDEPFSDVVARLNRYRRGKIVVMNSDLANRRVSGVFPTSNLDTVVDTITAELGARAVSAPPLVTFIY